MALVTRQTRNASARQAGPADFQPSSVGRSASWAPRSGLQVFDISNRTHSARASHNGWASVEFCATGNYAVPSKTWGWIFDMSDPANLKQIGSYLPRSNPSQWCPLWPWCWMTSTHTLHRSRSVHDVVGGPWTRLTWLT